MLTNQDRRRILDEVKASGSGDIIAALRGQVMPDNVEQAVPELEGCNHKMYYGGPVDESLLFYIHSLGNVLPKSVQIGNGLYWGGEFESLINLNKQGKLNSDNIKFFVGYSGWEAEQLEGELEKNSWIIGDFKKNYLFQDQNKTLWNNTIGQSGDDSSFMGNFAHSPSMN